MNSHNALDSMKSIERLRLDPAWVREQLGRMTDRQLSAYLNLLAFSMSPGSIVIGSREIPHLHTRIAREILAGRS